MLVCDCGSCDYHSIARNWLCRLANIQNNCTKRGCERTGICLVFYGTSIRGYKCNFCRPFAIPAVDRPPQCVDPTSHSALRTSLTVQHAPPLPWLCPVDGCKPRRLGQPWTKVARRVKRTQQGGGGGCSSRLLSLTKFKLALAVVSLVHNGRCSPCFTRTQGKRPKRTIRKVLYCTKSKTSVFAVFSRLLVLEPSTSTSILLHPSCISFSSSPLPLPPLYSLSARITFFHSIHSLFFCHTSFAEFSNHSAFTRLKGRRLKFFRRRNTPIRFQNPSATLVLDVVLNGLENILHLSLLLSSLYQNISLSFVI